MQLCVPAFGCCKACLRVLTQAPYAGPNCRADRRDERIRERSGPFVMRSGFLNNASVGGVGGAPAAAAAAAAAESKDDGTERGAPRARVAPADEAAEPAPTTAAAAKADEDDGSEEGSGEWETASDESA